MFDVGRRLLAPETKKQTSYRLLGIGVSHLDHVTTQTLFDHNGGFDDKRNRLEAAMDQLQGKLGIALFNLAAIFPSINLFMMMTIPLKGVFWVRSLDKDCWRC